jgi:multiple sugar transport system substrate-binding protein
MITRRGFLADSSGALVLGLASACGGVGGSDNTSTGKGTSGTLSTQGFGKPDEVGQARVDAFKSAYPNVRLALNEGDFDAQQFLSAVASGNPPDLVYLDRGLIGTYAAKGAASVIEDR